LPYYFRKIIHLNIMQRTRHPTASFCFSSRDDIPFPST